MFAEIITIGDEILIGQIIDSNSAWIAQQLNLNGILVKQITSISDDKEHIVGALNDARQRADLIITTGGLGPTRDDITKNTLAAYFNTPLIMNEEVLEDIKELFKNRGRDLLDVNKFQAMVPEKCQAIRNKNGTAPAMWIEDEGKVFVSLPGVPYEMKAMMEEAILPKVKDYFKTPHFYHQTVLTQGIGESSLMGIISKWEDSLVEENIKLAYLPSPGIVRLRVSAIGDNETTIKEKVERKVGELKELIPEFVFGDNKETLEEVLGRLLKQVGKTVATAESCTGGYIAHLITSISGSSTYFKGSVVSYANEIKEEVLGVSKENLEKYGAVSEAVVLQMAEGAKNKLQTDYAVATSGVAGPTGGSDEKPVGTVWVAVAGPNRTIAKKYTFGNSRERNIRMSALQAMSMLRKEILQDA
ncbi:MAG: competence/damage-inducible protein A [Crocinitomicaceae bacterium]|nr:competence/damage-inducible protein A [Crocinitomicaceae bacterium]|tara:strand:- start:1347 stop:2594 length:1248 start_codon:yes stop_codon:yes gene_type:complete